MGKKKGAYQVLFPDFEGLQIENKGAVFSLERGAQGDSISLKKSESHFPCNKRFKEIAN